MGRCTYPRVLLSVAVLAGACSPADGDGSEAARPRNVEAAEAVSSTTSSSYTTTTTTTILASTTTTTAAPTSTTAAPTTTTVASPPPAPAPPTTPAPVTTVPAPKITAPPPPPKPPAPPSSNVPTKGGQRALAPLEPLPAPTTPAPPRNLEPYRGLGTWVDAYDFSPQYQPAGRPPTVNPDHVDAMAREGIRTLYLQAAKDDPRSPGLLVNPEITGPMLARAHAAGIKVVAWYLPKFYDIESDLRRFVAMRDFRFEGHGFDGIGNDVEWRGDVADHAERSRRLIELSRRLRELMGTDVVAAIPLPPIVMEVVNQKYWPDYPWRETAPYADVWMPMAYWTFRTQASGYKDGYTYTEENIRRMRLNLGRPDVPVHPVGGTDGKATDGDYAGFVRAAHEQHCIGASIYDWQTTPPRVYGTLRESPT